MSYFTSDAVANAMKYTDRRYRNGEYVAEVLLPIRNLEIFLKQPAGMSIERYLSVEMIVMNGMMVRSDIDPEDKVMIMNKFSMFCCVY